MHKLDFHIEAEKEYHRLDGSQKILIDKSLKRIKQLGLDAGETLNGALHTCRKLKHKKAGLRVIFRESKIGIEIIAILAIGKRDNLSVYKDTEKKNSIATNHYISVKNLLS